MFKRLLASLGIILALAAFAPPQQNDLITLSVSAGFNGSFREDEWMPVYIQVKNDGDNVEGRLVVRPETSNGAVNSAFSLPISLPSGSSKAAFLYITAQSFASEIRVELINQDGVVVAARPVTVRSVLPRDQLHVVVTQSATGVIDLTGVHDGGYNAFQATWTIANIPDRSAALSAVDMMIFNDIDTGTLSTGQSQAIKDWVAEGGHLLVTGGPSWQSTAAGLTELLPLTPSTSTSLDSLSALSDWLRSTDGDLTGSAVVATGTLSPDADVLVSTSDDLPLLARRSFGAGTVDYLVADPNTQPLRGWGGLTPLWLTLATTVNAQPPWSHGFTSWETANDAVNILPGVDLLPDILPLCGFLAIYIALIGPLNYLVLNRLNRREWAWVTIPLFIIIFSALAWAVGFNLRGNEVTLSRLSVIESWPDADHARVQELVGLLSPRRAQYSLSLTDNSFLHPIPLVNQSGSLFGSNLQVSTDIQQTDVFRAADFPVDASFIAPFHAITSVVKPEIDGQATLFYDNDSGLQIMRGSVTNGSEQTLQDPVILVRGQALALGKPLAPGAVEPFEITLPGEGLPSPSPLSYDTTGFTSVYFRSSRYQNNVPQTVKDILGEQLDDRRSYYPPAFGASTGDQETYRRQLFLASFIQDSYNILTGRGDHAYLVGWTNQSPLGVTLDGGSWKSLDTSLYLVQLAVDFTPPAGEVLVSSDQFTWMVQTRSMFNDVAPVDLVFQPGDEVTFRYTPLPDVVLGSVNELLVYVDRGENTTRTLPLYLWNWENGDWEQMEISSSNRLVVRSPERFLGPQNAVQIRIVADEIGGYPRFDDLSIEQRGQF